jgi:quercetin dioxygenase-like cupin family protein
VREPGRVLLNRATGQQLIIRRTSAQTGGRLLEVEALCPPGGWHLPDHRHPLQDVVLEVLAGTLRARLSGRTTDLSPGDVLVVPAGAVHSVWNPAQRDALAVWCSYPALDSEALIETLFELERAGRLTHRGVPRLLQAAVLLHAFRHEVQLAWPPEPVQRAAVAALARIGTVLGHPSHLTEGQLGRPS